MNRKAAIIMGGVLVAVAVVAVVVFRDRGDQPDQIRVGTILGLTGDYAAYGEKMQQGFQFALDEVNSAVGVEGRTVDLVIEDSQFDPTKAVTAYRKLTGAEGIEIIVGITGSKNALPVCQAARHDDVVIVDALGSAPKLTTHGGPNYFRVMPSDALAGSYNVGWASEEGMQRPVIVYMEDDWGSSYRDSIVRHLQDRGFSDTPAHGVTAGTRDFRVQIEKVKAHNPDTIFLLLYAKEGAGFMQQLRQGQVDARVYGSDNISSGEFTTAGAEVVEGVRVALPAPASGPRYEEFAEAYRTKYGENPDASVIKSYDAMMLTIDAIRTVGTDPAAIRDHLRSPDFEYQGVSGRIAFDENGDLVDQDYRRMIYRSGELVPMNNEDTE